MLDGADIETIIYGAIAALNAERDPGDQIPASPDTALFGVDAVLDSLSFVSLITDVETSLNVDHGLDISLADDRALSRAQSPYETVATLRDYVVELVEEGR
jgi:acyl carrier protein